MKNQLIIIISLLLQSFIFNSIFAQDFTPVSYCNVAVEDYNNDGNQDILLSGTDNSSSNIVKLYRNNGDGTYSELNINLPYSTSSAWSDYNNDGLPDFFLSGTSTYIFNNNGDDTFTELDFEFPYMSECNCTWGDYNDDGFDDILLIGKDQSYLSKTILFQNNSGNGTFTEVLNTNLPNLCSALASWADYNNDGYLDVFICGRTESSMIVNKLYENNNGDGTFLETGIEETEGNWNDVMWFDYNNDGNEDIFIYNSSISLHHNNGDGTFTRFSNYDLNIDIQYDGAVSVKDINNDNYPDLLITGKGLSASPQSNFYINNSGNGTFTKSDIDIIDVWQSATAICDFNNDTYLDFFIAGETGNKTAVIYSNSGDNINFTIPELKVPENFLLYQSLPVLKDMDADIADYDKDGNNDIIFIGENSDEILPTKIYKGTGVGTFYEAEEIILPAVNWGAVNWVDYDNDDDLDIFITGTETFNAHDAACYLYENNDNAFTEVSATNITPMAAGGSVWGNLNNDNFPDLFIFGYNPGHNSEIKIYKNNGDGSFTDIPHSIPVFDYPEMSNIECVDIDNDGFDDIYLGGFPYIQLFRNMGNETFEEQTDFTSSVLRNTATWDDYNNDGYIDAVILGQHFGSLFINNSDGTFTEQAFNFVSSAFGEIESADFDNDGNTDILVSSTNTDYYKVSILYKNLGNAVFVEQTNINITGADGSYLGIEDFNNDNFKDFVLFGTNNSDELISEIYVNNTIGNFRKLAKNLTPECKNSFASWADFNKDSFSDLALTGIDTESNKFSILCNSIESTVNSIVDLGYSNLSWVDYNNDGFADLFISGENSSGTNESFLYKNGTNEIFPQVNVSIIGLKNGFSDWADFNHDGLNDLLVSGTNNNGELVTKIYKNSGDDNFDETNIYIEGSSKAIWGDYDNDMDHDIMIINSDNNIVLYENRNNAFFKNLAFGFDKSDDAIFTDLDNNGFIDILSSAYSGYHRIKSYMNYGNGGFSGSFGIPSNTIPTINNLSFADIDNNGFKDILINGQSMNSHDAAFSLEFYPEVTVKDYFPGTINGNFSWADWDNDQDLDLYVIGEKQDGTLSSDLYINNIEVQNSAPSPPENLGFICKNDTVFLSWEKANDNETPQDGLTYNCYIYEVGGDTIWHSLSNHSTGKRYIREEGNVQHNISWFIQGLDVTKEYAWSVQAVDNSFTGGIFAPEQTFRLAPAFTLQPIDQTVCETGSITFNTATTPAQTYQWYRFTETDTILIENNEYFSNATSPNLTITNAMLDMLDYELHCAATTVGGTTYSEAAVLTVDTLILANAGEDGSVCVLREYQLFAENPEPEEGSWSCNVQQVTFSDIHAADAMVFNLPQGSTNLEWKITQENVCGSNSDIVVITQNPDGVLPDKASIPEGETQLCIGSSSIISTAGANNAESYIWEIIPEEAGTMSQIGTNVIANWNINYLGLANIRVQAENECGKGLWSENLTVELQDIQATDIIQKSETMLISVDSGYVYQWYFNETLIPGSNKQYYYNANLKTGNYRVKISFYEGCDKLSSIFELNSNNKSLSLKETINLFPNPTSDKVTIEIDNDLQCKVKYTITDNLGRIRKENIFNKKQNMISIKEDLSDLTKGNYLLEFIFDSNEKVSKQLIIK